MKKLPVRRIGFMLFGLFIALSLSLEFAPGVKVAENFASYAFEMVKILPFIFILIGLFEVWVNRETIERHLGHDGGAKSYFWVFILAMPMGGGLLPALPIGHALYKKGARLSVVLTFLGAASIARLPMVLLESTFLGWRFSVIRLCLATPLVIASGVLLGRILDRKGYTLPDR